MVTHGVSFQLPEPHEHQEVCLRLRSAVEKVSLGYVRWHSQQEHQRGLPNIFGGICVNTWGQALSSLSFVEAYAVGMRSIDERVPRALSR